MSLETPQIPSLSATETVKFSISAYPQISNVYMTPDHYGNFGRLNWQKVVNIKRTPTQNNQILILEGYSLSYTDNVYLSAETPITTTYASDFTSTADGWTGDLGTITLSGSYNGKTSVSRFILDDTQDSSHTLQLPVSLKVGKRYRVTGWVYVDEDNNSRVSGVNLYNDASVVVNHIWQIADQTSSAWHYVDVELTPTISSLTLYVTDSDGSSTVINGNADGDEIAVVDFTVEQLTTPWLTGFSGVSGISAVNQFNSVTTLSALFPTFSGTGVNTFTDSGFQILNDNKLEVTLPKLENPGKMDIIVVNGAGYNSLQNSLSTILNIYG